MFSNEEIAEHANVRAEVKCEKSSNSKEEKNNQVKIYKLFKTLLTNKNHSAVILSSHQMRV